MATLRHQKFLKPTKIFVFSKNVKIRKTSCQKSTTKKIILFQPRFWPPYDKKTHAWFLTTQVLTRSPTPKLWSWTPPSRPSSGHKNNLGKLSKNYYQGFCGGKLFKRVIVCKKEDKKGNLRFERKGKLAKFLPNSRIYILHTPPPLLMVRCNRTVIFFCHLVSRKSTTRWTNDVQITSRFAET